MKKHYLFITLIGLLLSCGGSHEKIEKLTWLKGTWQAKVQGNDVFESWSLVNDTAWVGESAFVKEGKTLFTEVMSIRLKNGKLQFISAVSDQNDAESVTFDEIEWAGNKIVFENKGHDFPQKITYELKNENEMQAYISGNLNGQPQRIDFNFTKQK